MGSNDKKGGEILPAGTSAALGHTAGNLTLGLDPGRSLTRALVNHQTRRQMEDARRGEVEEHERKLANPPPVHGSARWATVDDLAPAGLLRSAGAFDTPSSILLGGFGEDQDAGWLHWDDEGHLMTVAPTRTGKSLTLIIPNLLRYRGSCVVLDPKGELFDKTSAWRATVGPVYRIAPFEEGTDAFNPFDMVRTPADARALADLMIPDDPHAQDYFRKDAISFLNGAIQYIADRAPARKRNLAELRHLTSLPTGVFLKMAAQMAKSDIPAVANAGNIVLGKSRDRGIPSLRDTLNTELSLWDDAGIKRATSHSGVDFGDLKSRSATVYITIPFELMAAFSPFLRVLLTGALNAMTITKAHPDIPVLFVLDEFLSLGPFPEFRDAIRTHAGSGVRLWFFLQNMAMLEEHYPTTWKTFFDATVRMFFGTRDPFTAEMVSNLVGETTVAQDNTSFSLGTSVSRQDFFDTGSNQSLNVSRSVNLTGRRLITPSEVVQRLGGWHADGTRAGIIDLDGLPPIPAKMVSYERGQRALSRIGRLT